MIIAGDVALGKKGMKLSIPDSLAAQKWLVNLEGSLVKNGSKYLGINGVFNDYEAIAELKNRINLSAVSLANNHILDASDINTSLENLSLFKLPSIGAGLDIKNASQPIEIDGYTILSFGWECIECPQASSTKQGVSPYKKDIVLSTVKYQIDLGKKVVCFFHWNYEFELYPQPFDRELAHALIEMGVLAIVGTHAHRVQHYEIYKGCPIVYGLGNFMFSRNTFFNGRLDFGERSREEILFELRDNNAFAIHTLVYSHERNEVKYISSVELNAESSGNAPYCNMNDKEYVEFFKNNRIQKKLLPIFYYNDTTLVRFVKNTFISLRGYILSSMVKLGIKSQKR